MGSLKAELTLSEDERAQLTPLARSRSLPAGLVQRANLVLACAEGAPNSAVTKRFGVTNATVGKWRQRFVTLRIAGLHDELRPASRARSTTTGPPGSSTATLHPKVKARHPAALHLHFVPTHSSRLNLVERFFAHLSDKAVWRGSFARCAIWSPRSTTSSPTTTGLASSLSGRRALTRSSPSSKDFAPVSTGQNTRAQRHSNGSHGRCPRTAAAPESLHPASWSGEFFVCSGALAGRGNRLFGGPGAATCCF